MGKGDKKTARGKIWRGSYGNTRPHRTGQKKSTITGVSETRKSRRK